MTTSTGQYPQDKDFRESLNRRYRNASIWQALFLSALLIAIISLTALLYNVVDGAFGFVAYEYKKDPATFTTQPLEELTKQELVDILKDQSLPGRIQQT